MATATKARPKKKARKARQQTIADWGPEKHPEIDRLAEVYVEIRDKRMELTKEETTAADRLELAMKKHSLSRYEFDGRVVELTKTEKVRVRRKQPVEFVRDSAAKREAGNNGD